MVRKTVNVKDAANFCADWEEIRCNCHEIPDIPSRYAKVLIITNVKNWLIGPYDLMCEVAEKLRWDETKKSCVDPELLMALTMAKARYGLRATDIAPGAVDKDETKGYVTHGKMPERKNRQALSEELKRQIKDRDTARDTDYYPKLADYWRGRTLEAHHIVEKGILKILGANNGKLKDDVAPSVLAFAELHVRYFTPFFARKHGYWNEVDEESIRKHFKHVSSGKEAYEELVKVYSKLYLPEQMGELCRFAEIISRELKDKATLEKH